MRWPWARRRALPAELSAALGPEERILAGARDQSGVLLVATPRGLWRVRDGAARRWGWELITKAVLNGTALTVTPAGVTQTWADGTTVLIDEPPRRFDLAGPVRLTDVVHARVRRSVAASEHLAWPGSGGWVVLRRVPGTDGLRIQLRLDPAADPEAPGFAAAVAEQARLLINRNSSPG